MLRISHVIATAALAFSTLCAAQTTPPRYRVQDLNALTGLDQISVQSLNDRGDFTLVDSASSHGYVWRDGVLHDLGRGYTLGLNKRGDVVGIRITDDSRSLPFLWRDGRFTNLAAALGARYGAAYSINESGEIVGAADGRAFIHDGSRGHFLNIPGAATSEGSDINDRGMIVGSATIADSAITGRAFVFRDGEATFLPQPLAFESGGYGAVAVNNKGSTIVRWTDRNDGEALYGSSLYIGGRYIDLGFNNFANAINDHDWAAGARVIQVNEHEFAAQAMLFHGRQTYLLDQLLTPAADARWQSLESVGGINNRGWLVGQGVLADGRSHAFLAIPVPEPGTMALMLAGLGITSSAAYRRNAHSTR